MSRGPLLGALSAAHQLLLNLVESQPAEVVARQYHPRLASLGWYLGRSLYEELYWLREQLLGDVDLSERVRLFFEPEALSLGEQCARLPPKEHLLNWAREILDEHLWRLANPGQLPASPWLRDDRLLWFLLQEHARHYESMLQVLAQRRLLESGSGYLVRKRLQAQPPLNHSLVVEQGHYRVGSRYEPQAYDNELPPQILKLSRFRLAAQPVGNGEYLAFMTAGGYAQPEFWSPDGWAWRQDSGVTHPDHWRQDDQGHWYGLGLHGPCDLLASEPVMGISQYEAQACANWVASLGGELAGAVLQHEYQWEVAVRLGLLQDYGRVWEWCGDPFHPYTDFVPWPAETVSVPYFDQDLPTRRGGSLHTQASLRRPSYRAWGRREDRHGFTGMRLVFPPGD